MGGFKETLIDTILFFYFHLVTQLFWLYNVLFQTRETVSEPKDPWILKSATKLAKLIRERKAKSIDIVESYINRIDEVNGLLNAVTCKVYDEARVRAKEIDALIASLNDDELAEYASSKPLLGLPFTMKDSISATGKVITVGMYGRRNAVCDKDAVVVQRMRNSGAILLAITTVPETCMWVEVNTYLWGKTCNPYDSRRIVGGSSGGEGALQGAAASLMGIGSDIGGSVRIPSFMNGIFGFISSPGVIPLEGHVPGTPPGTYKDEMARIGPMTRFAEDLPLLHSILSGKTLEEISSKHVPLDKVRFFYAEGPTHYKRIETLDSEVKGALMKVVNHFERRFKKIASRVPLPETDRAYDLYFTSYSEEGEPSPAQALADLENIVEPVNCFRELLKYPFGKSTYSLAALVFALGEPFKTYNTMERKELNLRRDSLINRVKNCLGDDGILFYPCWSTLPPFHNESIFKQTGFMMPGLINVLGLPAVQCPIGLTGGIPNGVMVVGNKRSEQMLLEVAKEISEKFGGWVPPGAH